MGAHTTTDDPTRYRLAAELEAWKLKDPIERVKQYLIRSGLAQMSFMGRGRGGGQRGRHPVRIALPGDADPQPLAIFENVYAEPNALLDAEREQFAAYLDTFVGEEAAR